MGGLWWYTALATRRRWPCRCPYLAPALRRALNTAGISVVDVPALANGRLELRYYLREQALSQTVHRYGNVMKTYRQT